MDEQHIKHMAGRFLSWRLPKNFRPDAGISYARPSYHPSIDATPFGTNLFDAEQAEEMVRYMVDGVMDWRHIESAPLDREVILGWWKSENGLNYQWTAKVGWAGVRDRPPGRNNPTHWMQLPDPPNAAKDKAA